MSQALAARGTDRAEPQVRGVAVSVPRLAQVATALNRSPRTQALIQRNATLQRVSAKPVIQRATEVKYETQPVGYKDADGTQHVEHVGKVADAFIDATDPITGTAPNSAKQQPDMYSRLKAQYGQGFVRGHLFNDNLGGVGEVYNLFPITYSANSEHKITAEGHLKRYVRAELDAQKQNLGGPYFVRYRVYAVPAHSADLTADARAEFQCEMVSMSSRRGDGKSETWRIFSEPKAKVDAIGDRSSKGDYQNQGLGAFGSGQSGEHDESLPSRIRTTVNGWRGDDDFKFASKGFGSFVDLAEQKRQAIQQLETELEDHPLYDEYYFEASELAQKLLSKVHDPAGIPAALQQVKLTLERWLLQRRKWEAWDTQRQWLATQTIPEDVKTSLLDAAKQEFKQTTDLAALQQAAQRVSAIIQQRVQQLLQPQH